MKNGQEISNSPDIFFQKLIFETKHATICRRKELEFCITVYTNTIQYIHIN